MHSSNYGPDSIPKFKEKAGRSPPKPSHDWYQTDSAVIVNVYPKRSYVEGFAQSFTRDNVIVDLQQSPDDAEAPSRLQVLLTLPPSPDDCSEYFDVYKICYVLEQPVVTGQAPDLEVGAKFGKVQIRISKKTPDVRWDSLGAPVAGNDTLMRPLDPEINRPLCEGFRNWMLVEKVALTTNVSHYVFQPPYKGFHFGVPCGHHVRLKAEVEEGVVLERDYTPVSPGLDQRENDNDVNLHFIIKTYEYGAFTPYLDKLAVGSEVLISNHLGSFQLSALYSAQTLVLLAAGTGLTPMIKVIQHFNDIAVSDNERRAGGSSISILFFNKKKADIFWKQYLNQLEDQSGDELSIKVHHVLSQEDEDEGFCRGRINLPLLQELLGPMPEGNKLCCICGPIPFNAEARRLVRDELGFSSDDIFVFEG